MNSLPMWYVLLILNSWALGDDISRGNVPLAILNGTACLLCILHTVSTRVKERNG